VAASLTIRDVRDKDSSSRYRTFVSCLANARLRPEWVVFLPVRFRALPLGNHTFSPRPSHVDSGPFGFSAQNSEAAILTARGGGGGGGGGGGRPRFAFSI
jgi:hypothetical protein